jgi:hypothetical protein
MFNTYIHKRQMNQKLLTVISTCLLLPSILQIKIGLLPTKKLLSETTISGISYRMGENALYAGVIEILVMKSSQWKS